MCMVCPAETPAQATVNQSCSLQKGRECSYCKDDRMSETQLALMLSKEKKLNIEREVNFPKRAF